MTKDELEAEVLAVLKDLGAATLAYEEAAKLQDTLWTQYQEAVKNSRTKEAEMLRARSKMIDASKKLSKAVRDDQLREMARDLLKKDD